VTGRARLLLDDEHATPGRANEDFARDGETDDAGADDDRVEALTAHARDLPTGSKIAETGDAAR
jgi:hypothetical protein